MSSFSNFLEPQLDQASVLFAAALVWFSVVVQHVSNVRERGVDYAQSDRSVVPAITGFYGRATRTLSNNMESALMYVPAVMVLLLLDRTSLTTHIAAGVYILARGVFTLSYWLRIAIVRSWAWAVGMLCAAVMAGCAVAALGSP